MAISNSYGAFFDESERLEAGEPLCVAGFVFKDVKYKQFCRRWARLLAEPFPGGRSIAAMHMKDLVPGKKAFTGVSIANRKECLRRAAEIISDHALLATGALVDQKEFEALAGSDWPERFGSSYTTLCQRAAQITASYLQEKKRFDPIVYTFEAGQQWEHEADQIFRSIGRTPFLKKLYQYGHHTFADKCASFGTQAADIIAWASVRIRMQDVFKPATAAFAPVIVQLVNKFNANEDAMITFLRGDRLKQFVETQHQRPREEDYPTDVGPKRRRFR